MARVTVEDCVEKVPNRFDLVMLAAQRARNISAGEELTLDRDNDKNPVVALREIAEQNVKFDDLRENLIRGHQRFLAMDDDSEDDIVDMMAEEEEAWRQLTGQNSGSLVAGTDQVTDAETEAAASAPASPAKMPDDAASAEAAAEALFGDDVAPDEAVVDKAAAGEATPDETGADDAGSDGTAPDDTAPDDTAPDDTAPDEKPSDG